jgi:hypothetical protein
MVDPVIVPTVEPVIVPVLEPVIMPVLEPVIVPVREPVIVPTLDWVIPVLDPVIVPPLEIVMKESTSIPAVTMFRSCVIFDSPRGFKQMGQCGDGLRSCGSFMLPTQFVRFAKYTSQLFKLHAKRNVRLKYTIFHSLAGPIKIAAFGGRRV